MRMLITGAGGTLGSYICRELLAAGHDVSGYSRSSGAVEGVTWLPGDAANCEEVARAAKGHDAIVHLAAIVGPGRALPEQLISTNLLTTTCALEAAVRSNVPTVVFASSGAALGFTFHRRPVAPRYFPIDEEHPCEPHDSYGLSKLLGELTCKSYSDAHGLNTVCLRVNNAWYVDRVGAELAVRLGWARGLTVEELWQQRYARIVADSEESWPSPGPVSPRKNLWAVVDARDVAVAFRLAVEQPSSGHEVFNLNGDDTCSLLSTQVLLTRYFPNIPSHTKLEHFDSLISNHKAARLLGFRPQHSWRRSDFGEWLTRHLGSKPEGDLVAS